MNLKINKTGFVLVLTLMIIGLCSAMILSVLTRTVAHKSLSTVTLNQEKAKALALGAIQIAMCQLVPEESDNKQEPQKASLNSPKNNFQNGPENKVSSESKYLIQIFNLLNRWQTFEFTTQSDNFDAKLEIYISCENGKIDLNQLFDFEKKQFKKFGKNSESKKILNWLDEKLQAYKIPNLSESLDKLFKKQENIFVDITQLLEASELKNFENIIFPIAPSQSNKDSKKIYLADIFTVDSYNKSLIPWALSQSLLTLMGTKPINKDNESQRASLAEKLKSSKLSADWEKEWNKQASPVYGIEWNNINTDLRQLFLSKFEPTIFSVICYATVGNTTEKLVAIISKDRDPRSKQAGFAIKKLYWI